MGTAPDRRIRAMRGITAAAFLVGAALLGGCARTGSSGDGGTGTSAAVNSTEIATSSSAGNSSGDLPSSGSSSAAASTDTSSTGTIMKSDNGIEGTTWTLVSATDKADNDVPVPVDAGATLSISDGKMAIHTGCNTGGGAVEVSPSALEVGPVATTRMACDESRMKLEQTVLGVLGTRSSYQVDGELLTLTNGAGTLVYRNLDGAVDSGTAGTETSLTDSDAPGETVTATPIPTSRFTPLPSTLQPLPLPSHTKRLPSIPEDPRGSTN